MLQAFICLVFGASAILAAFGHGTAVIVGLTISVLSFIGALALGANNTSKPCTKATEQTNGVYYCTRKAGHGGPCAAVPIPLLCRYREMGKSWRMGTPTNFDDSNAP